MEAIKTMLGSSSFADIVIYAIIVAVFIVGLTLCILPVIDTRNHLRRAIRDLRAGERSKRSWQENNFLGRGSLLAHWSAYMNNLFFADGVYHNASNVEDFINEDTVIYGPGRSAFADAVPSLLVSLGFLGTLIGLARGLAGFDMTDFDSVQNSITTLIPGMKYAFVTSIFGVVGSVTFTMITRAVYGSAENTIKSFYGALRRHAGVLSVDPLTQVAIYQQEQTALIQTMAKDLNGTFTDNIAQIMQETVDPLQQSLQNFITVSTKEQMRFLDAVVSRFIEHMDSAVSGRLKDFARVLDETTKNQEEAYSAVRMSMVESAAAVRDLKNVQKLAQEMIEATRGYIDDLRKAQKDSAGTYQKITESVEQMDLVSRRQNEYLKTISAMQTEVTRSVDAMTTAVKQFGARFNEDNAAAAQAMQKAAGDLKQAGAQIQAVQTGAVKAIEEEISNTLDAYRDYVNQFTQRVDYLASGITESLSGMPQAVNDTADEFLARVDRLSRTMEQAQRALEDAIGRLNAR